MNERGRGGPGQADVDPKTATLSRSSGLRPASPGSESTLPAQPALWLGSQLVSGRLNVIRQLGQGGMGTVYQAFDAERRCHVALKTLNRLDAASIYALKNEFRSLCDVHHHNLVRLHELFCDQNVWFFSMDLIEGERFDEWVRPAGQLDESRLRFALLQLVDALEAIHRAGKLHRDVKPSNVLVRPDGILQVLDFGLVVDPTAGSVGHTLSSNEISGTPDYMAPEQAMGQRTTTATDFYALGVMLFEALSGARPFTGSVWEALSAKLSGKAPAPLAADLPEDLRQLCAALLSRDPAARPGAAEIRARLSNALPAVPYSSSAPPPADDEGAALLGRGPELAQLREAYVQSCEGAAVVLSIAGDSGIGKSALCRAFLRELSQQQTRSVLLTARCFEQENVPFKAIDPVIDELSRYLRRLRPEQAAALLPRDAFALAKLFPVLARVSAFEQAPPRHVPDPRELQRLAFVAFGELLSRIRDRAPLVIFIDDLQWTDADSAKLLRHCLVSREAIPLLFVFTHRLDQAEQPLLQSVIDVARDNPELSYRGLQLQPLTAADAELLAARWLGRTAANDNTSSAIAAESRGNPFFAMELARFAQRSSEAAPATPSLDALLDARVQALPEAARRLLRSLALTGRPMSIDVVLDASGAARADLDTLRDAHLVRGSESPSGKLIECYHDCVRERVVSALAESERTELHKGLARALLHHGEPELLSRCLEGAGDAAAAAEHAALAAAQASAALAFDHAAELYQRALSLGSAGGGARRELLFRLGSALENAGRGGEAAAAYLQAAELSGGDESLDLQRRAAEQLLHTGQLDRGSELLREVCAALGIELPSGAGGALLSLGWSKLKLRLHALDRPAPLRVSPRDALRLRTLRTAVTGLTGYKPVHGANASALYLLCALERGDAADRVRALGFHSHNQGLIDPESPRVAEMLARTLELAQRDGQPELIGFAALMQGTDAYHHERCHEARGHLERARKALRECTGVEWEIDAVNIYDQLSALYGGDYADIARSTPGLWDQAARRHRIWAATMFCGFAGMPAWLVGDDIAGYRQKLAEARALWATGSDPGWPGFVLLYGEALLSIYAGEPSRGFDCFSAHAASGQRLLISRTALTGALGYASHRGRCAAAALGSREPSAARRAQLTAALRESVGTLKRRGLQRSLGMGSLLAAALAASRGEDADMLRELRRALELLDAAEAGMHAAATRRRLGQLLGGSEGAQLIAAGDAFMRAQGVRQSEPMTELNCPGFRLRIRE